ncbi:MAG: alpha/beta hydrolase [Ferruginibacter sp.]
MKNRWTDTKAVEVFKQSGVPLKLYDTIINRRHLHYAVSGEDALPLLVFIHGSPSSWRHYYKYLSDSSLRSHFQMLAIDRPGFGLSDFGKAMHLQEQCNIILPLIQSMKKNRKVVLFGHSYGGPVVVTLAALDPALAEVIVIAAGAIDVTLEKIETWRRIMNEKPLYWLLPGAFGPSNTELLFLKKDLIPMQEQFKLIKSSVYFIHGDKDTWVPIQNVKYGREMLVNAKSISIDTIKGADHHLPGKNKIEISELLLRLL